MNSLTRRRLLCGVSLLPFAPGCLDVVSHESIALQLVNWRDAEREVTVAAPADGFEASFMVPGNDARLLEDVIEPDSYELEISVDTGESIDFDLELGDCADQLLTIRLERPGRLFVSDDGCYPESAQYRRVRWANARRTQNS